jgi:hypothetical protein
MGKLFLRSGSALSLGQLVFQGYYNPLIGVAAVAANYVVGKVMKEGRGTCFAMICARYAQKRII